MSFAAGQQIADAVLYEGYALYPYRASSSKNRVRWQFGVLAPRAFAERTESDPWFQQSECLIDPAEAQTIDVRVRGLQVQRRTVESRQADGRFVAVPSVCMGGEAIVAWDEGVERAIDLPGLEVSALLSREHVHATTLAGDHRVDDSVTGVQVVLSAEQAAGTVRLRLRIENVTTEQPLTDDRAVALRQSLVGVHTLIALSGGRFISLLEPPDEVREAAAACINRGAWPVLVGARPAADLVLCSPIILYDYPSIAPESPGSLFDGTEIDEILTLRIMTMTDAETREARATDERAREIIDRVGTLNQETLERLHGTFRDAADMPSYERELRELLNPAAEPPPEQATIAIDGVTVGRGSRVILRPTRRADAIDMFVAGRRARVEGVYRDLEGRPYLAVVLDDDPAGDLHAEFGRFLYYGSEEVEPVVASAAPGELT